MSNSADSDMRVTESGLETKRKFPGKLEHSCETAMLTAIISSGTVIRRQTS